MEAKDTEKGRHVVVFIALSITWPSILYLFICFSMYDFWTHSLPQTVWPGFIHIASDEE